MFKTLTTLFKAQSHQVEEALIDANAAAILSQKISEAEAGHAEAKRLLATMIAQVKNQHQAAQRSRRARPVHDGGCHEGHDRRRRKTCC